MPNGHFYFGKAGFSNKKHAGGSSARPPTMDMISNVAHSTIYNTFTYGSGVGARNLFIQSAQLRALPQRKRCIVSST